MRILHALTIRLYALAIKVTSFYNRKAQLFLKGRKEQVSILKKLGNSSEDRILWHCASLGEYEQARPLIEAYHRKFPSHQQWISFFSPSGYENAELDTWINGKLYLPLDLKKRQGHFIKQLKPTTLFLVKYEIWPVLIETCAKQNIPVKLVCAHFRPKQLYFKPWGKFYLKALQTLSHIYLQQKAFDGFERYYSKAKTNVIGDARFDKALNNVAKQKPNEVIQEFCKQQPTLILGSSWSTEHKLVQQALQKGFLKGWKIIIAPHLVDKNHIQQVQQLFPKASLYTKPNVEGAILIINTIGILKNVYQYADVALIGGGFTGKLHNTIEAAAFGCMVCFGPRHQKFPEAELFLNQGMAKTITSAEEFEAILSSATNKTENKKRFEQYCGSAKKFETLL